MIRVSAVVLHGENLDLVQLNEVVEGVRKTLHQIAANTHVNHSTSFGRFADLIGRAINRDKELSPE